MQDILNENRFLKCENNQRLKRNYDEVIEKLKKVFNLDIIKDPKECQRWTGLPNFATFNSLAEFFYRSAGEYVNPIFDRFHLIKPGPCTKLSFQEEFFLVLVRLKTGNFNFDIAQRFGISDGLCSDIFTMWVLFLNAELKAMFELPDASSASVDQAHTFEYFDKLYMVIDATELFSEAPANSQAKKEMYSSYKSHYTSKFLVGMLYSHRVFVNH